MRGYGWLGKAYRTSLTTCHLLHDHCLINASGDKQRFINPTDAVVQRNTDIRVTRRALLPLGNEGTEKMLSGKAEITEQEKVIFVAKNMKTYSEPLTLTQTPHACAQKRLQIHTCYSWTNVRDLPLSVSMWEVTMLFSVWNNNVIRFRCLCKHV